MYGTCLKTLKKREDAFNALTGCHPTDRITLWETMDDQPKLVDGNVISVYEARFVNGKLLVNLTHSTLSSTLSTSDAAQGLSRAHSR